MVGRHGTPAGTRSLGRSHGYVEARTPGVCYGPEARLSLTHTLEAMLERRSRMAQPPVRDSIHNLRRPETGMLGLTALIVLLIAGVSERTGRTIVARTAMPHRRPAGGHGAAPAALLDAETGQRGFLLTGDEHYLEPYTQAIQRAASTVAQLPAF